MLTIFAAVEVVDVEDLVLTAGRSWIWIEFWEIFGGWPVAPSTKQGTSPRDLSIRAKSAGVADK